MEDLEDLKKLNEFISQTKIKEQEPGPINSAEGIDCYNSANDPEDVFEDQDDIMSNSTQVDIDNIQTYTLSQVFSDDEKRVIEDCMDPELKEVLILNRKKNFQLMQLHTHIKNLLIQCQNEITDHKENITKDINNKKRTNMSVLRPTIPYFKTKDNYPCPPNAYIQAKIRQKEMPYYEMRSSFKWLENHRNKLLKGVAFQYRIKKQLELENSLKTKTGSTNKPVEKSLTDDLECLSKENIVSYPDIGCRKYIDWRKISDQIFKNRFSPIECEVFWNIYLHPYLNKLWSAKESARLKTMAKAYNFQNWDQIAKEIGGNRTGFIACIHYYGKIRSPGNKGRFTPEEDRKLCALVENYKEGDKIPWTLIAQHFSGRIRRQLFHRYTYYLSCQNNKKRGKFTTAEDILLMILVDRFGTKFTKCTDYFPTRTSHQLKARYTVSLKEPNRKGSFTIRDDRAILNYVKKHGAKQWMPLVNKLNRCSAQIRQRYQVLTSFLQQNPNASLEEAPRRRFIGLSSTTEHQYARFIADKFRDCDKIPTVKDIENLLQQYQQPESFNVSDTEQEEQEEVLSSLTGTLTEKQDNCIINERKSTSANQEGVSRADSAFPSLAIDDMLTDLFSTSLKIKGEMNITKPEIIHSAGAIGIILGNLQAKLHIPKNLEQIKNLDNLDRQILKVFTENKPVSPNGYYILKWINKDQHQHLVPPDLSTVICLRSLLIKNQIYKSKHRKTAQTDDHLSKEDYEKQILWCINTHLKNQTKSAQNDILRERNLFHQRFISLFKIPALLSIVEPLEGLQLTAQNYKPQSIKTYTRKRTTHELPLKPNALSILRKAHNELNKMDESPVSHYQILAHGDLELVSVEQPTEVLNTKPAGGGENMAERLKKKITETIHQLSMEPHQKKFYHENPSCFIDDASYSQCNRAELPSQPPPKRSCKVNIRNYCGKRARGDAIQTSNHKILEEPNDSNTGSLQEITNPVMDDGDLQDIKLLDWILEKNSLEETFDF